MDNKIFIAIDTNKLIKAKKIIQNTNTKKLKIGYKFGLEFISSKNGRSFISKIKDKIIFLDLKLHDIPNTCLSAVKAIKDLKVNYLTIHISSGLEALKAAKKISGKTKLVGVTTLTSIDSYSLRQIGYDKKLKNLVVHQAKLASKAKLDAIVCSAQEVKNIKKIFKKEIITPGIRFNSSRNDQKRVMTPKEAFKNGCDWLVMGRPITRGNVKKNIQTLIDHLNK
jgi:orotidine-5'-phosphate decarboxylase